MNHSYKAYQKATHTVSKTRQVVMLYEGILRNLQQAKEAIEQGNIGTRFNKLKRGSDIIIGLQMSLDFDSGKDSARTLYDFYSLLDARIMQLHRSQSLAECEAIISEVRSMHEVWDKIDRGEMDSIAAPALTEGNPQAAIEQTEPQPLPYTAPNSAVFSA